jgi:hypothetical protein
MQGVGRCLVSFEQCEMNNGALVRKSRADDAVAGKAYIEAEAIRGELGLRRNCHPGQQSRNGPERGLDRAVDSASSAYGATRPWPVACQSCWMIEDICAGGPTTHQRDDANGSVRRASQRIMVQCFGPVGVVVVHIGVGKEPEL